MASSVASALVAPTRTTLAYEGLVAAKSGRMKAFGGIPERPGPAYAAVQVGIHAAAQALLAGVIAALLEHLESSGKGQVVEASMLQGMMPYDLAALVRTQLFNARPELFVNDPFAAMANSPLRMPTLNYHPVQAKDGRWLQLGNLLQHLFDNFLSAADLMDVYADPRYAGPPPTWTLEDREEFRDRMLTRMRELPSDEWMKIFVENGGVVATDYRPAEAALDDHDLIDNGHVLEEQHPVVGKLRSVGPGPLEETPAEPGDPSHEPGADQSAIAPRTAPAVAASNSASPHAPLEGVTVLEFAGYHRGTARDCLPRRPRRARHQGRACWRRPVSRHGHPRPAGGAHEPVEREHRPRPEDAGSERDCLEARREG